jgi:hypothetical protein
VQHDAGPQACPDPVAQGLETLEGLGLDGGAGAHGAGHQLVAVVLQEDQLACK